MTVIPVSSVAELHACTLNKKAIFMITKTFIRKKGGKVFVIMWIWPEVGGMAAAWPYCDAVVSAHNLDALDDLLVALK
jgi:hypothetical protein